MSISDERTKSPVVKSLDKLEIQAIPLRCHCAHRKRPVVAQRSASGPVVGFLGCSVTSHD